MPWRANQRLSVTQDKQDKQDKEDKEDKEDKAGQECDETRGENENALQTKTERATAETGEREQALTLIEPHREKCGASNMMSHWLHGGLQLCYRERDPQFFGELLAILQHLAVVCICGYDPELTHRQSIGARFCFSNARKKGETKQPNSRRNYTQLHALHTTVTREGRGGGRRKSSHRVPANISHPRPPREKQTSFWFTVHTSAGVLYAQG